MRTIKFEVLHKWKVLGYERLTDNGWECMCIDLNPVGGEIWTKGVFNDSTELIRRQFTGLTDKNLIDIYENDKLINPEGKVGLVVYYDGRFRLQIHKSETSVHYIDLSQGFCNNKAIK